MSGVGHQTVGGRESTQISRRCRTAGLREDCVRRDRACYWSGMRGMACSFRKTSAQTSTLAVR